MISYSAVLLYIQTSYAEVWTRKERKQNKNHLPKCIEWQVESEGNHTNLRGPFE